MFRARIQEDLKKIFGFKKATFNAPSDSFEQDTLFISIEGVLPSIGPGKERARVRGAITTFAQTDKFPFGYFNKRILHAPNQLTRKFFFFDVDSDIASSPARLQNISERRTSFLYLYDGQYDPNQGGIDSLEFEGGSE